jgi:hypothetical protein
MWPAVPSIMMGTWLEGMATMIGRDRRPETQRPKESSMLATSSVVHLAGIYQQRLSDEVTRECRSSQTRRTSRFARGPQASAALDFARIVARCVRKPLLTATATVAIICAVHLS